MRGLKGKVAIVTGGASGIGLELSQDLATRGVKVFIADVSDPAGVVATLRAQGLEVDGIRADVSDPEAVQRMVQRCEEVFGGLNILINNAALFTTLRRSGYDDISLDEWNRVLSVNVTGPFLCTRAAWPLMKRAGGGRVIHITSTTVFSGPPRLLAYVASKGALLGMTHSMAREMGPDGITVNAVAPGFTLSSGVLEHFESDSTAAQAERSRSTRALPRDQAPQDLVGAIAFLASDESAFMTGQTLIVDGGAHFN
jgi:NAD(P)-dependent dehydrogenase (short-subunit alcohol dehydrogenase family)